MISKDSCVVLHNEEMGCLYCPNHGKIHVLPVSDAITLKGYLDEYFNGNLSNDDSLCLEEYLSSLLNANPELPFRNSPGLNGIDSIDKLEILVATDCNLRCRYCYANGGSYGKDRMRLTAKMAIRYLEALFPKPYRSVRIIEFFGGEPTLCPDTIEAVCCYFKNLYTRKIIDTMPQFLMVSNCTLIDGHMAKIISEYKIGVTMSIDGPKDINDLLRIDIKGNGTFDLIRKGVDNLKAAGTTPIMIEATYTELHKQLRYSKESIKAYLRKEFDVVDVMVADCDEGGDETLVVRNGNSKLENETSPLQGNIVHTYTHLRRKYISPYGCTVGISSFALLPNGDIYPCHFFIYHPEYRMALFDGSKFDFSEYPTIRDKFESISMRHRSECSECWAKPVCFSCSALALLENNRELKEEECNLRRKIEEQMILKCVRTCYAEKHGR